MVRPSNNGERYELTDPTAMPRAAGFLWNRKMMIQATCRGYAVAQFMQPEPAKYSYAPNLEAKTFMQPEQAYYAHHPGRFVYVKDEETGALFSAPYEPVRAELEGFNFSVGKSDLRWLAAKDGVAVEMVLSLARDQVIEFWTVTVRNHSGRRRKLSLYPCFTIGYMSWMNQSARYHPDLGGIVAACVTPYQKVADYFKNRFSKDKTFVLAETTPDGWEAKQEAFEGEGGLHNPSALRGETLSGSDALYETPVGVFQYRLELPPGRERGFRFLFGPAFDDKEIAAVRRQHLSARGFAGASENYAAYIGEGRGCLRIQTPDPGLDNFVNHWLPRQVFYHGDVNRLTTDPQTRNYLQDNMGMSYIKPDVARAAFLHALTQQEPTGAMPDGILLTEGAELKYINQVPHTDHCVWLPVCLQAYLDETNDYGLLREAVTDRDGRTQDVFQRIGRAMHWLLKARDERGLSYIAQGDWCDPMNMVGYKGKGVSGWLSVATAYALNLWADICEREDAAGLAHEFRTGAHAISDAVNRHLWDGQWFGRGITDDGAAFGVKRDKEGRIFLNVQSWAILAGVAAPEQRKLMIEAIAGQLETPYGPLTLAPAFTSMREDVGRVTQKFPGSAENGSVYNHDSIFYIFSLYRIGERERAFRLLRQMIPGPGREDLLQRGQLPVFIPNYYRGAHREHPRTAGRSSQLFNTGTVSWFYRCLVEGLFGLKGDRQGLLVQPQLPAHWQEAKVTRHFRGATFQVHIVRDAGAKGVSARVDGRLLRENRITGIEPGRTYQVRLQTP